MRFIIALPYTALSVIASIVLFLAPSLSIANTQDANIEQKTIGAMIPISGKNAHLGKMVSNAMEMAWYTYAPNTLSLTIYDTQSDNNGTKNAYSKANEDGIKLIIGPLTGSNTSTIRNHFNSSIINLSLSNNANYTNDNLFIMGYTPQSQGIAIAKILERQSFERAVIFLPSNPFGDAISEGIGFMAGTRISKSIYYPPGSEDFTDIVKALVKDKEYLDYDAIILADGNPSTIRILAGQLAFYDAQDPYSEDKKNKKTSIKKQIPMIGALGWHALNGAYKEPQLLNWYYIQIPHTQRLNDFDSKYKKLYGKKPTPLARLAYDITALSIIAMYSDNVKEKLMQQDGFKGISGTITMGYYGIVNRQYTVMKVGRKKSTPQYTISVPSK